MKIKSRKKTFLVSQKQEKKGKEVCKKCVDKIKKMFKFESYF